MGKKINGSSKPLADVPSVHPPMFQASTLGNMEPLFHFSGCLQNKYKRGILIDNSTKHSVFYKFLLYLHHKYFVKP